MASNNSKSSNRNGYKNGPIKDHQIDPNDFDGVSKSAKKREMDGMFDKVEELLLLSTSKIKKLDLGDNVTIAIEQGKLMKKNGARKRQLSYIRSSLMKMSEETLNAIDEMLDQVANKGEKEYASISVAEHWLIRLLDASKQKDTLSEWIEQYPESDIQQLRTLIRNTLKAIKKAEEAKANEVKPEPIAENDSDAETAPEVPVANTALYKKSPEQKKLLLWLKNHIVTR